MNQVATPILNEIRRSISTLFEDGAVVEIRAPKVKVRGYSKTYSGYFDDYDKLAEAAKELGQNAPNIYVTLQEVKPDLLARAANRIEEKPQATTSDNDITRYRWLLIDLDPTRPSGISSTDEEKHQARLKARALFSRLEKAGWPAPVVGDSGNGWHLLYRIDLPANEASLVQRCLQALAILFDDDQVRVDQTCFNPSRICKLYGTWARKGDNTEDRPHRQSELISVPDDIQTVSEKLLQNLASLAPNPEDLKSFRARHGDFKLTQWIEQYGFSIASGPLNWNGGQKWILAECPFSPEHQDRSAYIVQFASGAIAAGCHHNSCQGWGWAELREKFDGPRELAASHPESKLSQKPQLSQENSQNFRTAKTEQKQSDKVDFSNFRNFRTISQVAGSELDQIPILPNKTSSVKFPKTPLHTVIWAIQERSQAPYVLCAQSVLAAMTLAVQHLADVAIPGIGGAGARRPISNFFMTIAKSGERKSSVDRLTIEEIERHQLHLAAEYGPEKRRHQVALWDYERLEKEARQSGGNDALDEPPAPPKEPLLLIKEPTQEGLFRSLKNGQLSQGLFNDEGGSFIGGYGMSKDHRMRTAATFNALWDGSKLDRPRANEYESIRGRRFCVHLMIQPKASAQIVGDSMLADLGFNARCLIAEPESTIGTRAFREPQALAFELCDSFHRCVLRCLQTKSEEDEHGLVLPILELSDAARTMWIDFYNEVEAELPKTYATIQGFASKAPEHAIRMAATFTLFADPKSKDIPESAMEVGIDLVRFYLGEHLRLEVGQPDELDESTLALMKWVRGSWGETIISMADITRNGPACVRKRDRALAALEVAVETGHLKPLPGSHQIKGTTRRQCFEVMNEED